MQFLYRLYCRFYGHRFMRITIAEQTMRRNMGKPEVKRCSRCSTERVIKKRGT